MNNQEKQTIRTQLAAKSFFSEQSKDYSLPDYQPEIKRLLRITANALPPKMDFGMDDAVFSGDIDYYVLYLGADNQMYCAPISDEYAINMPLESSQAGDYYDGFVDIVPENIAGRVTAPRKITIRSKLRANVTVFSNFAVSEMFSDGEPDESIRKLSGNVISSCNSRVVSPVLTVTDEVILDARDGEIRVICADGKVMLTEVKGNNGEMYLRGDVYLKIIACRESTGVPYIIQRKIPFFSNVPIRGACAEASLYAKGSIAELSVIVDEGRISLEVGVVFDCTSCENMSVTYTKDMYSTVCETRCDYKKYKVACDAGGMALNITSSEARTLDELSVESGSQFIDASGIPFIESIECEGGRIKASGKIKYALVLENGGEYGVKDVELPFSFVGDAKNCEDSNAFATCEIISTKGKIDGERISLDSELALTFKFYKQNEISSLEAMHFGESRPQNKNQTVVVFPSGEDSAWSIAKKYGTTPEKIMKSATGGDGESFDDTKTLMSVHHIII